MSGKNQGESNYFDGIPLTSKQIRLLILLAICYMFDQMDTNFFSYAAPVLQENWGITLDQIAQANSLCYIGMFVGAIGGGWLANKIGRKNAVIASIILYSLGSLAGGLSQNFIFLAATRFVVGIGLISMIGVTTVYITEMTPSHHRGKIISLTIALGTIGVPVGAALSRWIVPMSTESWRIVFVFGGATILLLPLCFSWFKESPRWLVSKNKTADAEKVIKDLTGEVIQISSQLAEQSKSTNKLEVLNIMFSRTYIRRTIVVASMTLSITLGVHLLAGFYPTMLVDNAGFELPVVLSIMAIAWWGMPLGNFSAAFVSDKGGRKVPLAVYQIINGLTYVACGIWINPVVITIAIFFSKVFGGGAPSMNYTLQAESYPTHIRSEAVGIISGFSRILSAVAVFIVPPLLLHTGWLGTHLFNAAIIIIPCIILLIWGERTGGKTLEELNVIPQTHTIVSGEAAD